MRIVIYEGDGEVFDGPVVGLAFLEPTDLSIERQEHLLAQAAERLRAARLPIVFMRIADGALIPFIEIVCDIEHHRRTLSVLVACDPDERPAVLRRLGIMPNVADLTREALDLAGDGRPAKPRLPPYLVRRRRTRPT